MYAVMFYVKPGQPCSNGQHRRIIRFCNSLTEARRESVAISSAGRKAIVFELDGEESKYDYRNCIDYRDNQKESERIKKKPLREHNRRGSHLKR